MIEHLLWIALVYGLSAATVRFVYRRLQSNQEQAEQTRYVLITSNHGFILEWIIRALSLDASLRGKTHQVTVVDYDSSDETMLLLNRLFDIAGIELDIIAGDESLSYVNVSGMQEWEDMKYIDLRQEGTLQGIPFVSKL
ncbi:hypothetical protein [Paenibacillus gallinarum]|uniref:Glycosyltransferase 2-like domain-containing protein n=1 Tax=Paenibacillus gallinarum TaxID=2762232 RepID=A0ABR8T091_9BACL|nr:hypothetical protein [Paenibacillus gallinarum]MBD7968953.1 hypothetical protein [Paenibacillus gallinarum]